MKTIRLTNNHIIFLAAISIVIIASVAVRYVGPRTTEPMIKTAEGPRAADSIAAKTEPTGLPQPTSASFPSGDALQGLGPNWTYVSQQDQRMMSMSYVAGTAPVRESIVQLINNPKVSLTIQESSIADQKMLDTALADKEVKKTEVAGREGYVVPVASLAGGTALVLTGPTSILIIQDTNTAFWPDEFDGEVTAYIATVRVP